MRSIILVLSLCVVSVCQAQADSGVVRKRDTFQVIALDSITKASVDSTAKKQVDSVAKTIAPVNSTVGPFTLPTWLLSFLAGLMAVLPAIQLVLKRIPTNNSVRIQGIVGWILDKLTFFQKDRANNNRDHP